MSRDRDVRLAIKDALVATNMFDLNGVFLWGIPEDYGSGANRVAAAAIEPISSTQDDRWDAQTDGDLIVTSMVKITFMYRDDDPQTVDETLEAMFNASANALNGQILADLTNPGQTKFVNWNWQRRKPPERRIDSTFQYVYFVAGWNAYDTTQ